MRSMFNAAPFSRFDLGRHAFRGGLGLRQAALGQTTSPMSAYALEDYAERIEGLADDKTKEELREKYKECRDKEGTAQVACYAALAAQVYQAVKDDGKSSSLIPAPITPRPVSSSFPIIPVVAAVLGAGALIYFLATQGAKK